MAVQNGTGGRRVPLVGRVAARRGRRGGHPLVFLVPAVLLVFAIYAVPQALNFGAAFTDWTSHRSNLDFVGLANFRAAADDPTIVAVIWQTLRFAIFVVVVENTFALALALALEQGTRVNLIFRALFFIPVLISPLAAGYIWKGLLAQDGAVNGLLSPFSHLLGGGDIQTQWLGSLTWTLYLVAMVQAWKWGGIHMMVYIAGLKAIPNELIEAARVEGASYLQIVRLIKLPLLAPAITFNVTLTFVGALASFEMILAMTNGGPAQSTEVLLFEVWRQFGQNGDFGLATAISLIAFGIIIVSAVPLIMTLRRREVAL
jgi:raffinose/stachyose/melibiose transport system permease protein